MEATIIVELQFNKHVDTSAVSSSYNSLFPTSTSSLIISFWTLSWSVFLKHFLQKPIYLTDNFPFISPFIMTIQNSGN
jgi:hypothetical protein